MENKNFKLELKSSFPRVDNIEARASKLDYVEGRTVSGYAFLFNSTSEELWDWEFGEFTETIEKGALTREIINASDIFATLNHTRNRGILARSRFGKGSLALTIDERGLWYEFTAANTPVGDELVSYLERGEITQSSFAFTVADEEIVRDGNKTHRIIKRFELLYDVSPVFTPAYDATSVALRSAETYIRRKTEEAAAAEAEIKKLQEQERAKAVEESLSYYKNILDLY
jgi:HK97 family phage prohead protease